jgi:hypothetical protein
LIYESDRDGWRRIAVPIKWARAGSIRQRHSHLTARPHEIDFRS